ncbi:hypothetical protein Daus18300_010451 [Diaporthe australafricana]|uniref:Heterokaryon incompatibility domain-containing protein n=1 Tax=Diaporthe australafricana TaxID=127596 RepID=A0ABR3WAM1_9PEZI
MALCQSCDAALRSKRTWFETIHSDYRSFLASVYEGCYICQGLFNQVPEFRPIPEEWEQELRRLAEMRESSVQEGRKAENSRERLKWYQRIRKHLEMTKLSAQARRKEEGSHERSKWYQRIRRRPEISESSAQEGPDVESSQERFIIYERLWTNSRAAFVNFNPYMGDLSLSLHSGEGVNQRSPLQILHPVQVASDKQPASEPLNFNVTSFSTNSEETFLKIKSWFATCEKTHAAGKCGLRKAEADVGWHPTRLIEIMSGPAVVDDNANDMTCRIVEVESENMPQNSKYITLSHHGDDYADWRKESPMMQKVYSNAEFNICASKSNQNELLGNGLFSPRKPSSPQPLQIEFFDYGDLDDDSESFGSVGTCRDSGHYLISKDRPMSVWNAGINGSSLASRGWVFQEQLLFRANVHFTADEVFFECMGMRASESLGLDQRFGPGRIWQSSETFKEHLPIYGYVEERYDNLDVSSVDSHFDYNEVYGDHFTRWHKILNQYTVRQLTNPDDKLIALSGVAQYFKRIFPDDYYIAGLWKSRLATELLWAMVHGASKEDWQTRNKTHRHLSFSWVSVKGAVCNQADPHKPSHVVEPVAEVELIKYRMSPDTMEANEGEGQPFAEDIFSLPSESIVEIRLTGYLRPMSLEQVDRALQLERLPGLTYIPDLWLHPWGRVRPIDDSMGPVLDFEISSLELTALNESGRLFFIPLSLIQGRFQEETRSMWYLLLELVETRDGLDMGRFRRIGIYEGGYIEPLNEWVEKHLSSNDPYPYLIDIDPPPTHSCPSIYKDISELPCWRYNEHTKQHTIFIV